MISELRALLPEGRRLTAMLILSALAAVLQGVTFVLLVPVLRSLIAGDQSRAWAWTASLLGVAAAFAITLWFATQSGQRIAIDLGTGLYARLGDKIARIPLGAVDLPLTGQLARLTSKGVMQVATVPAHLIRPIITAIGAPVTVVAGMTIIDPRIGLTALVCLPLLMLTHQLTARIVGRRDRAYAIATEDAAGRIVEFARVQPALRSFQGSRTTHAALQHALGEQGVTYRALLLGGSAGMATFALAVQTAVTLLIVVSTWLALGGGMDVAALIALQVLALRFAEPLMQVGDLAASLRVSANSLAEMRSILDTPELPEPAVPAPPPSRAEVRLEGVSFSYTPGRPVLRDVSFTVAAGTTTAIVGPSGSGKTTLTKLIARFHDVDAGRILLGGADVRDLGTAATMSAVSPVFQDVYLFSGTLMDNIRMGRPDAPDHDVLAAARAAEVDEIAERLGAGWESEVGEGGSLLSGGERQRVSIARAILKDAPILLLDEATSSLDPVNERAISRALHHLDGRTRIVVAHRLDTVAHADQIVVLTADGRISDIGTHSTLMNADGDYARFWRARTEAAGWTLTPPTS